MSSFVTRRNKYGITDLSWIGLIDEFNVESPLDDITDVCLFAPSVFLESFLELDQSNLLLPPNDFFHPATRPHLLPSHIFKGDNHLVDTHHFLM